MTALDTIVFLAGLKGVSSKVARTRAIGYLEAQGLEKFIHEQVRNLSKGMSQKVQLISTLVHEPEILILDEPFSGLDPVNQEGLERVIIDASKRGATVLFSTHVMAHAERLCQNVVMLSKGQKVFDGTLDAAKACAPRYIMLKGALKESALLGLPGVESVFWDDAKSLWSLKIANGHPISQTLKNAFLNGLNIEHFDIKGVSDRVARISCLCKNGGVLVIVIDLSHNYCVIHTGAYVFDARRFFGKCSHRRYYGANPYSQT
jgi:ABC-2 type transport system ATP-binding protein